MILCVSLPATAQQQYFQWDGNNLQPLYNTQGVNCDHWAIWLYTDKTTNPKPARGWGEIDGSTAEDVQKKYEQTRDKMERLLNSQHTGYEVHLGPVCITKPAMSRPAYTGSKINNTTDVATKKLVTDAFDLSGNEVVMKANEVLADYKVRQVHYHKPGDASKGGSESDCNHFVNDVLKKFGLNAPLVTTGNIGYPAYVLVPQSEAKSGDIMVQRWFNMKENDFEGHMGIYTGLTDPTGHPLGVEMGTQGIWTAPWGPGGWFQGGTSLQFYRLK